MAGDQKGRDDDRYLWPEFSRLVGEIRPLWVVAENVSGILNLAADDICKDLERLGYRVGIWCYEAAAVGANHRRMRVFFVAHSESERSRSWKREQRWPFEADGERTVHKAPRPSEPSCLFQDAGRRMREGRSIAGAFRGEHEERAATYPERSGRPSFPDADCERREEQRYAVSADGERSELGRPECGCGRPIKSGLGRVADGLPPWLDGPLWWGSEPDSIPRTARGVPDRVNRLRALGNAVVPAQAAPIFRMIMEEEGEYSHERNVEWLGETIP
ncbi:MAG: DNA cytosine methyltransferase [Synergistaceae bacterium]|nr:DNA cytosine methyltransferase [Synergistaceae bacterium]